MSQLTKFIQAAQDQVGKDYVWGAAGPDNFDCSGLVYWCYTQATGQQANAKYRDSHEQYQWGEAVGSLQPGDLLFFDTAGGQEVRNGNRASHVGIYIAPGVMVNALNPSKGVVTSDPTSKYFNPLFLGARRLFPPEPPKATEEATTVVEPVPTTQGGPKVGTATTAPTATPAATSTLPTAPQGPVQTPNPKGQSFGIDWSQINQYDQLIANAASQYGVPFGRIKSTVVIESQGKKDAKQTNPSNGNSYGLMQIVPYGVGWAGWNDKVEQIAGLPSNAAQADVIRALNDPATNLKVGASILKDFYIKYGSWDAANSAFFTGTSNWNGTDTVNSTTGTQYKNTLNGLLSEIWTADGTAPTDGNTDQWRPYPWPSMIKMICQKPYEGAGFDRVAARATRVRGFCTHITDGSGSIEWYHDFFSTGGERATDALVDLIIGTDGRIGILNDWRDPNNGGTRAPWANGGVDGLEGDGIAFYRNYPDINSCLVSCEHVARTGQAWTDAMLASTIEIRTALAQSLKIPWDSYPLNSIGVSVEQQHRNFATKACPANPYINTYDAVIKAQVKQKLKDWQGGVTTTPVPPAPEWQGPLGLGQEFFVNEFGTLVRYDEAGTEIGDYSFDPKGAISLAWMKRGEEDGVWPEAQEWRVYDSTLAPGKEQWVSFANGWRLWLPLEDSRAAWSWLDKS